MIAFFIDRKGNEIKNKLRASNHSGFNFTEGFFTDISRPGPILLCYYI